MKISLLSIFIFCSLSLKSQKNTVTELISYKVTIQIDSLTQPQLFNKRDIQIEYNQNWYMDKIEYKLRSNFIYSLHYQVRDGKVKVFEHPFEVIGSKPVFTPLSKEDAANLGTEKVYVASYRDFPPYDSFDTVLIKNMDLDDVIQLEFLEKWTYKKNGMGIKKEVIAFAPWRRRYNQDIGEFMGCTGMYWVPVTKKYFAVKKTSK